MKKFKSEITGHLDVIIASNEDEFEGKIERWQDVLIHGDPEGLRSLAKLLVKIANLDQDKITDIPVGAREHFHLRPDIELGKSSVQVVVGRLDAKGTGRFYDKYEQKSK
ncbi:hypothetical protein KXQ82_15055 [Mucilaginibacter sp. HMF5004]|uniref:Imm32 family immunity protein n=1 Tax=Mucilaginibacter rivuli TaxID=2857527 RepID=UPI001C5FDB38|nr:hypothetical protein [Mucilaginibacter rivuli]MBW4891043.1 hypothetical protein [Mucilaginibacter rivuli]